jgi:hypothetical protein
MPQEQRPRRRNFSSRMSYKQELGKWRRNWLSKAWRQAHLKRQEKEKPGQEKEKPDVVQS